MTKKKYDETAHKEFLQRGSYSLSRGKDGIRIDRVNSGGKGGGFGTAVMREVMKEALEKNKAVTLDASWSSHIFHLYMGMVPIEREEPYVEVQYGFIGEESIENLKKYHTVEDLNKSDDLINLLRILKAEKKLSKDSILTAQDVIDNKTFLIELTKKSVSYLTFRFIPHFLRILEIRIGDKYPDTSGLTSVQMELSKQGKERWQEAINERIEFSSFKGFEQLIPFMTAPQKEKLDSILQERPLALAVAAIDVNFINKKTKEEVEAHKTQLLRQVDSYNGGKLIQRTITQKKEKIEQDAQKQIKEIDNIAAMVQQRKAEEQLQQQLEEQRAKELEQQQRLQVEQNNAKKATGQDEKPLVKETEGTTSHTSVTQISKDVKTKLTNIISILIKNISEGTGGRFTSSTDHKKVTDLTAIRGILIDDKKSIKIQDEYINEIMDVCKIKRNSIHFWSTPHSVDEFKALLKDNNIMLPSENKLKPF